MFVVLPLRVMPNPTSSRGFPKRVSATSVMTTGPWLVAPSFGFLVPPFAPSLCVTDGRLFGMMEIACESFAYLCSDKIDQIDVDFTRMIF